jgi:hypothetical protein
VKASIQSRSGRPGTSAGGDGRVGKHSSVRAGVWAGVWAGD